MEQKNNVVKYICAYCHKHNRNALKHPFILRYALNVHLPNIKIEYYRIRKLYINFHFRQGLKYYLKSFYEIVYPSKLQNKCHVERIIKKYKDNAALLIINLFKKYNSVLRQYNTKNHLTSDIFDEPITPVHMLETTKALDYSTCIRAHYYDTAELMKGLQDSLPDFILKSQSSNKKVSVSKIEIDNTHYEIIDRITAEWELI